MLFQPQFLLNKMKSKRGLSEVVATVLLVLLSVAAVAIVSGYLVPWITEMYKDNCFDYQDYFFIEEKEGWNCYQDSNPSSTERYYAVTVGVNPKNEELQEEVAGFYLSFINEGSSYGKEVINGANVDTSTGGVRMFEFAQGKIELPVKNGEFRTYVYKATKSDFYSKTRIALKLNNGKSCSLLNSEISVATVCENSIDGVS